MPIYAYRCGTCGHAQDVLQKMSDPLLTECPACGAPTFHKQVTAAGFQLKGSGWYVTDFRGGNTGAKSGEGGADKAAPDAAGSEKAASDKPSSDSAAPAAPASAPASAPAPAAAPASGAAASPPAATS